MSRAVECSAWRLSPSRGAESSIEAGGRVDLDLPYVSPPTYYPIMSSQPTKLEAVRQNLAVLEQQLPVLEKQFQATLPGTVEHNAVTAIKGRVERTVGPMRRLLQLHERSAPQQEIDEAVRELNALSTAFEAEYQNEPWWNSRIVKEALEKKPT